MNVSVIIPLFNRKGLIGYTLDSLREGHHGGVSLEVIVVDDGSTDGAFEYVQQEYPWVKLYRNPKKGAPSARNFGLSIAQNEYVHFLDSDDLVEANFFMSKLQHLEHHKGVGAVIGQWDHFDAEEAFTKSSITELHSIYPVEDVFDQKAHMERLLRGWYIPINAFVHRKMVLVDIGGFDETLMINQDVDLTFKIILNSSFVSVLGPKVLIRQHLNERVGRLNTPEKIVQMINLRKAFVVKLREQNIWNQNMANALSEFCFNQWKELYLTNGAMASEYLRMSKEYNPKFELKGGLLYRYLGKVLGNERAYLLKMKVRELVSKRG